MKKYRTGIVGTGFIGVAHIEALRRLGNIDIVAICDKYNIEMKAKNLFIDSFYYDYKKMINDCNLDYIHICTPNNTHYEIAKYALEHDVNIVLEKPMTFSVEEAIELYKLAKTKNLVTAVNFHNRLYPATAFMKQAINDGLIGDIISINGVYLQDWLLYETDYSWRLNTKESGKTRVIADIGSHWLDLVEYISGQRITEVMADFRTVHTVRKKTKSIVESFSTSAQTEFEDVKIDTEDVATLLFRLDSGTLGNATFSQVFAGKKNKIDIFISGTRASFEWKLEDLSNVIIGYRDKPNSIITKDFIQMNQQSDLIDYPAGHTEGFPDSFKQVFKQVYNNSDKKLYATFYDGLHQMILNEKIYQSAKTNKWVKIEEEL